MASAVKEMIIFQAAREMPLKHSECYDNLVCGISHQLGKLPNDFFTDGSTEMAFERSVGFYRHCAMAKDMEEGFERTKSNNQDQWTLDKGQKTVNNLNGQEHWVMMGRRWKMDKSSEIIWDD